jgi:long-chain acyl-CoA synthetase
MENELLAGDLLDAAHGKHPAIVFENLETYSHGELDQLANRFAHCFQTRLARHGGPVSFLVGNDPLLVAALFGAFRAGVVANPINIRLTPPEIAYILNHAESRLVVVGNDYHELFLEVLPLLSDPPAVFVLRGPEADDALRDSSPQPARASLQPEDPALLIYTSGTTGHPKGVVLSHRNLTQAVRIVQRGFAIESSDRSFCVMPLFHTNALMFSHLPFLAAGATVVLRKRFSASRFWSECLGQRATVASASPTILALLLEHEATGPACGETGLKYLKVASAPTPIELAERFEARFGKGLLLETYGLTETTAISTMNPLRGPRRFGSIGKALEPQELAVLDEQRRPVAAGRAGELALRGPTIMKEYLKAPEQTREAMHGDWFLTGDMAVADEDGFVRIVGRRKEMILRGGENISPLEVEQAALEHPAVREAAAVGLADAIWGETVGLAVVAAGPIDAEELLGFCSTRLSAFKLPQHIAFVQELPRNAMGKVLRPRVRECFETEPAGTPRQTGSRT